MFSWKDAHGSYRQAEGISRDISSKGEFVLAHKCPEEGAVVRLKIILPSTSTAFRPLHIQAQGTVVRVEAIHDGNSEIGFAVRNQRRVLRDVS